MAGTVRAPSATEDDEEQQGGEAEEGQIIQQQHSHLNSKLLQMT